MSALAKYESPLRVIVLGLAALYLLLSTILMTPQLMWLKDAFRGTDDDCIYAADMMKDDLIDKGLSAEDAITSVSYWCPRWAIPVQ